MIRLSTTTLEQFRRCVQTDYASFAELADSIRGRPFAPSWQMSAGTAWHTVLENSSDFRQGNRYASGSYSFSSEDVNTARAYIGSGVWEAKAEKIITLHDYPVCLVAQADHSHGLHVQDNKTKFSTMHIADYEPSLQWRLYLWIHGAQSFRYNLWQFGKPDGDGSLSLYDYTSCRFWPYAAMQDDCWTWLHRFYDWAVSYQLLGYLDRQSRTPEFTTKTAEPSRKPSRAICLD